MSGPQTGILIALGVVVCTGVFGAVMAPDNTPQIIGFTTLIATSLLGLLAQIYTAKRQDEKLDKVDRNTDATHTLVNSHTSAQLRANAIMARRLAALTNDPNDHALADAAEEDYHEHEAKQAIVDKGFGVSTSPSTPRKPLPPASVPAGPAGPPGPPGPAGPSGTPARAAPALTTQKTTETDKLVIGHDEKANVEVVITKEPKETS